MTATPLGSGPEFDRIRAIAAALGSSARGLGDDCAFVPTGNEWLALSTDVSVERVHFRREWLSLEEIGWRAAASALSDLAAAGAVEPVALAALTVPAGEGPDTFASLMRGVGAALAATGGVVIGGDLSKGEAIALAITVVGRARRVVGRRGAEPGDALWVTGALGGARAALTAWNAGRQPAAGARIRFAHPAPRLVAGRWLVEHGAKAMLDLSDGLAGDAKHLAAASGVALRIDLGTLPLDAAIGESGIDGEPAGFAAQGGEDYELLVAMPAAFRGTSEFPLTRIGEVSAGLGVTLTQDGRPVTLAGYDHFA